MFMTEDDIKRLRGQGVDLPDPADPMVRLTGSEYRLMMCGLFVIPLLLFYIGLYTVKVKLESSEGPMGDRWKKILSPFTLVFLAVDILFNLTVGTFVFFEWPRELYFSCRVTRLCLDGTVDQKPLALRIAGVLNATDPNHIGDVEDVY
jgi:hypothetical protein